MERENKRKQLRERNRMALIEAALDCVAELGIARTSVSTIIQRAGLSRGMIHLHFDGKDKLLEAAVAHANAEYYDALEGLLSQAGSSPQEAVDAVIRSDLSETILNRRSIKIWYAFRGEARERAAIAAYSDTRDKRLRTTLFQAFVALGRADGRQDISEQARDATHGTLAMLEGMWTDFLLHPDRFDRAEACRIVFRFLAALYPQGFTPAGARLDGSVVDEAPVRQDLSEPGSGA